MDEWTHERRPGESPRSHRAEQLQRVSEQLAAVLESVDLEHEKPLAEEVADAYRATERAYELETTETAGESVETPSIVYK